MLKAHKIAFSALQKQILQPINAVFETGKIYGVVGHNGSGKSTFIKILGRQLAPTMGKVIVDNEISTQLSQRRFSQKIAYLPQHIPDAGNMTVYELVRLGRYAWHGSLGRYSKEDEAVVINALEKINILPFKNENVDSLSGGERQRVWIAMCLAQQCPYLLLDEPLSALDINYQVEIMDLLRSLSRTMHVGIVIVLHDINLVARYCDEVLAFKGGRLIHHGHAESVIQENLLNEIYNMKFVITSHPQTGKAVALP
ncbi:ABC transporter ATP-binding protein [Pectobacterium cacticida]|uniref:ABC transporter ATP-binding protein n=1 Tax=Pectobacterium cacticida TaxID=69221 RepID=UPI0039862495